MNNKFLKSTLRFGLGISLLMTLVACPAEPEESKDSFDSRKYNSSARDANESFLVYYYLGKGNGRNNLTIDKEYLLLPMKGETDIRTKLEGPIRLVEENTYSEVIESYDGYSYNYQRNNLDKKTYYHFSEDGLLTEYDDYNASTGSHYEHGIFSYDRYDNITNAVVFDGDGQLTDEETFSFTYDAEGLMLTKSFTKGFISRSTEAYASFSKQYSYEYTERHPNGFPKVINTFMNDSTLYEIREFDNKGQLIKSSRFEDGFMWTIFFSYNENGSVTLKEKNFYQDSTIQETEEQWFYDEHNQLIKTIGYKENYIYDYDQYGRVTKRSNQDIDEIVELTYDEDGNLSEKKISGRPFEGSPLEYKLYTFENYDRYGNPTLFTISENGRMTSVVRRKLEYYE